MALAIDHIYPISHPDRGNGRHLRLLPTPAPIRLPRVSASTYRRRRLVAMAVIALLGAVAFGTLSGTRANAGPTAGQQVGAPRVIIAQSGDTLWAIARRVAPEGNIAELVEQLVVLNGDAIQVGQQVRIP